MTKSLTQHQYSIHPATADDVSGIGLAHFQSTKEAYLNEDIGITNEWMDATWSHVASAAGDEYRLGTVAESENDPDHVLYLAANDSSGKIAGFVHATKTDEQAKLEGLYLLSEAHGTGLANDFMVKVFDFAGDLPITLEVADYNQRAIHFYEKHGFKIVPGTNTLLKERLPVISMIRPKKQEDTA